MKSLNSALSNGLKNWEQKSVFNYRWLDKYLYSLKRLKYGLFSDHKKQ